MPPMNKDKIYKEKIIYRDYFKVTKNIILKTFKRNSTIDILDIGCSNGSFLFYLKDFLPKSNLTGVDNSESSLRLGRKIAKKYKDITFIKRNVLKFETTKKFDVIIVSGLLCFFDDFKPILNKIIKNLKKNEKSKIILFGDFNPYDVDKIIKFRDSRNISTDSRWRSGYTTYSIKTISEYIKKKNLKLSKLSFLPSKHLGTSRDPLRSYTVLTKENKKLIACKAGLIFKFYFLTISKK